MTGKISEFYKIDSEVLSVSSASGATSQAYDLRDFPQAEIVVALEGSYMGAVTIDLMESSAATAAGSSAAGSKAGISIGATANTNVAVANGVRDMVLLAGGEATGATGDSLTVSCGTVTRTFTFTTLAANLAATAWSTSKIYFGAPGPVESSANTGRQLMCANLGSALLSTLAFAGMLSYSTPSTNTLRIQVADAGAGPLGFASTGSTSFFVADSIRQSVGAFDIRADQLTSTANKRFISVKVSTASTACRAAVTLIRSGGRYLPPAFKGKLSS